LLIATTKKKEEEEAAAAAASLAEFASELYRPSDRRLSAFEDRGCHVVSVTDSHGHILGFLDRLFIASSLILYF
jgi:hypothetical protein